MYNYIHDYVYLGIILLLILMNAVFLKITSVSVNAFFLLVNISRVVAGILFMWKNYAFNSEKLIFFVKVVTLDTQSILQLFTLLSFLTYVFKFWYKNYECS